MKSFFIETWGCQMNDLDSQRLSGSLKLRGYTRVDDKTAADLILLNTCSVRDKSEQKVLSELGRLRELKREKNGELTIGVCGCVAQQEGERILQRAPWVDFVMGPGNVGYLDEVLAGGRVEIERLGQTVNAYRCPVSGRDFGALLAAVAEIEGVVRLRFMTSHPSEVSDSMIAAMRDHANVWRYLHLPVQSGSSKILRRMKRLYTRERYLEVIARIRAAIPEIHFSTDVIVGFPGETEDDFAQSLSLIEEVRYGSMFAFNYSPRPGTPALKLGDVVDDDVASERLTRLFDLHERIKRDQRESYRGRVMEVLVEGASKHDPEMFAGRPDDNYVV